MSYSQIFQEIYCEHKKFIRTYITLCLVFSILAFGTGNLTFASQNYNTAEIITIFGGNGGGLVVSLIQLGSQAFFTGMDISTGLMLMSVLSIICQIMPEGSLTILGYDLSSYSFGLFDYNLVRIFILIWFVVAKLSRSNRISYTVGLIFEDLEGKMGQLVNFCAAAIVLLANTSPDAKVQAASLQSQPSAVTGYGFHALVCFILLISILILYLFVRFLFYYIDIALLPVCILVPFSAWGIETLKTLGMIGLFCIAIFFPYLFAAIALLTLIVAIILFKKAYIAIRYFKNIYCRPFFRKFRGYDSEIPLVVQKAPKKVKLFVAASDINIMIPVYILGKISGIEYLHRYDRWWFVSAGDKQFICKPCFGKNNCHYIELDSSPEKKMFIKKSLRFFEIFNLKGNEENIGRTFRKVHKNVHFVFSKEYYYRFEKIKEMTGFTDYAEYAKQIRQDIKLSKRERREQKRQERLEAKEEKRIARV